MRRLSIVKLAPFALAPLLLAGTLAGTGCGLLGSADDQEYRAAPPSDPQVTIGFPGSSTTATTKSLGLDRVTDGEIDSRASALVGQVSEYYQLTYGISSFVNTSAVELLGLVRVITLFPSTSRTATSRTWGPHTPGGLDPLTYRVVIKKLEPELYSFAIEARAKDSRLDADFVPLLDGEITPGPGTGRGKGTMNLRFDNRRKLRSETCEQGTVHYAFNNTAEPATLDVSFQQVGTTNAQNTLCKQEPPRDAMYHYDRLADGSGNFVYDVKTNAHKAADNKPLLEQIVMRSRWKSTGTGRSDVKISGGEVDADLRAAGQTQTYVSASQCWDNQFKTTYQGSSPAALNLVPADGQETSCAFSTAMLPN
ncbi:MAG: hypothetical protein U1A78_02865 [Polyangia bacterium]